VARNGCPSLLRPLEAVRSIQPLPTRLASPVYNVLSSVPAYRRLAVKGITSLLIRVYTLVHIDRYNTLSASQAHHEEGSTQGTVCFPDRRSSSTHALHKYSWLPDVLRVKNSVRFSLSTARSAGLADNPRLFLALSDLY